MWLSPKLLFVVLVFGMGLPLAGQELSGHWAEVVKPSRDKSSDLQDKTFQGAESFRLKSARVKTFGVSGRPATKAYATSRSTPRTYVHANERAAVKTTPLPEPAREQNDSVETEALPVKQDSHANKHVETGTLPEQNLVPPPGSGPFKIPIPGDPSNKILNPGAPLTVEQVREILNKSK